MKLPEAFAARMQRLLGAEYEAFLKTYEQPRCFGLRVNTLKITAKELEDLVPFSLEPLPGIPGGYRYQKEQASDPSRHPFYYAGLYYLQEPSAMTPASVLPVEPGDYVLDLCAAPGGKATALAAKLGGTGLLVANDISASRAKALLKNLEVFGVRNSLVTNAVPARLAEQFGAYFDKILVDAPCSGEGMFRKDAANARAWSLEKVRECAKIQKNLTRQAVSMLKPGGMMVYSTCTFAPEEDEQVIAHLLRECPEMELCEIPWQDEFSHGRPELCRSDWEEPSDGEPDPADAASGCPGDAELDMIRRCVRLFPHKTGGEGHFLALLRKKESIQDAAGILQGGSDRKKRTELQEESGSTRETSVLPERESGMRKTPQLPKKNSGIQATGWQQSRKKSRRNVAGGAVTGVNGACKGPSRTEWEILDEFFQDVTMDFRRDQVEVRGSQVYLVQEGPRQLKGIPFLRNGLYLGEIRRDRFEPSQSFAMALKSSEYASVLELGREDERVIRYLKGETIDVEDCAPAHPKGWQLVCVDGYPLGWGRLANGLLKNKYHSGWRMQG